MHYLVYDTQICINQLTKLSKKAREFQKNIYFCFIDYTKAFVWITTNCGKFLKRWEYQTTWPASLEIFMQVKSTERHKNHKHICSITTASKYIKQTLIESKGKIDNILNGKRLKAFPLRSGKIEGSQFYHCYWPLY